MSSTRSAAPTGADPVMDTAALNHHRSAGAHPMIQPTRWDVPLQQRLEQLPQAWRGLYRIVHDAALANTLRAPLLRHERLVWNVPGATIAMAWVGPADAAAPGYWYFRTDHPPLRFPAWRSLKPPAWGDPCQWRVTAVHVVPVSGFTMRELLGRIERAGLTTPAGVVNLVHNLTSTQRGWVTWQEATPQRMRASDKAIEQLRRWQGAGIASSMDAQAALISAVREGELSLTQALQQAAAASGLDAQRLVQQMEEATRSWGAAAAPAPSGERPDANPARDARPPRLSDIPSWLDPDESLAENHPLQLLRRRMEQELAAMHPQWMELSDATRCAQRQRWLQRNEDALAAALAAVDQQRFDVLAWWLRGGPPSDGNLAERTP